LGNSARLNNFLRSQHDALDALHVGIGSPVREKTQRGTRDNAFFRISQSPSRQA
jgi:hypothetical protein